MAGSRVVTNRKKLDAFFKAGGKIEDLVLQVGVLTGSSKYPKGHVGRRSRRGGTGFRIRREETERRAQIRGANRQLEGLDKETRKATLKGLKAMFKAKGIGARTLGRRAKSAAVAVARVAGVMAGRSNYHRLALRTREGAWFTERRQLAQVMLRGIVPVKQLKESGRRYKSVLRSNLKRSKHVDTSRLLRNLQFQIVNKAAAKKTRAEVRAARTRRQQKRRATKRRKKSEARR